MKQLKPILFACALLSLHFSHAQFMHLIFNPTDIGLMSFSSSGGETFSTVGSMEVIPDLYNNNGGALLGSNTPDFGGIPHGFSIDNSNKGFIVSRISLGRVDTDFLNPTFGGYVTLTGNLKSGGSISITRELGVFGDPIESINLDLTPLGGQVLSSITVENFGGDMAYVAMDEIYGEIVDVNNPDIIVLYNGVDVIGDGVGIQGTHQVGTTQTITFAVTNRGPGFLFLNGSPFVSLAGLEPGEFNISSQPSNVFLGQGDTTYFDLTFAPTKPGTHNVLVRIPSTDPDEATYEQLVYGFASAPAKVRFSSVNPAAQEVTIKNYGDVSQDITNYTLSTIQGTASIQAGMVVSGDLDLAKNEEVTLLWTDPTFTQCDGDIGLYVPNAILFDPSDMIDYVQWGAQVIGNQVVASDAGIWTIGDFVTNYSPFTYSGDGFEDGLTYWSGTVDVIKPIVVTDDMTVYLDGSGSAQIDTDDIDDGSYDNGCLSAMSLSQEDFDCSHLGSNTVYLVVSDAAGNIDSASASVTVLDTLAPSMSGGSDEYVTADENCEWMLSDYTTLVVGYDNCSAVTITQSPAANSVITQDTEVTITATDGSGNEYSETFTTYLMYSDLASFMYSSSEYCLSSDEEAPIITGTSGGIFSSASGLDIDSQTGNIDFGASASGTYKVFYTTCSNKDSVEISVEEGPDAFAGFDIQACIESGSDMMEADDLGTNETGTWTVISGTSAGVLDMTSPSSSVLLVESGVTVFLWTVEDDECSNQDTVTVRVDNCLGTASVSDTEVSVYPSVVAEQLTLEVDAVDFTSFQIVGSQGRVVMQRSAELSGQTQIDVEDLRPGVYHISIVGARGEVTKTFIKE